MWKKSLEPLLNFSKYEGAGNDFILIDDRAEFFPKEDRVLIRRLCHRRFGIGADGLILLQTDQYADFRMRIFNCDGMEADGCGNGSRCLMRFIEDLGLPIKRPISLAVGQRVLRAEFIQDKIAIEMGDLQEQKTFVIDGKEVHFVHSGAPHAVLFTEEIGSVDLAKEGPKLRSHPLFMPHGANVNIASLKKGHLLLRTYEKGVESETLACGTGAVAAAAIASKLYGLKSPILVRCRGGDLEIAVDSRLKMLGEANRIFQGSFSF